MSETRTIRKYPNRRLYDTQTGQFINTETLRQMVVDGDVFKVVDSKTKADLTRSTLLQVLTEAEDRGEPLLSEEVLRQMIRFYGSMMQSAFGPYLEQAIRQFLTHQDSMQKQLESLFSSGPMSAMQELARNQNDMLKQWSSMWAPADTNKDNNENDDEYGKS